VPSRTIEDLKLASLQVMNFFLKAKVISCEIEPLLKSHTITAMLDNHFVVNIANAPPLYNRASGTFSTDTVDIILLATTTYNKSIHSVIEKRPVNAIQEFTDGTQEKIADKIKSSQDALRSRENASRQNRVFEVGEKVLVKTNRRLGNKLTPWCEGPRSSSKGG